MRRLATAAAFILFAGAAVPAHANTLNIAGTFNGNAAIAGFPGPLITETFTGSGVDTTFGAFSGQESSTVNISGFPNLIFSNGTFLWTFASGFLSGTFSGSGTGPVVINFLITGGLLPGNSGVGTATESFVITSATTAEVSGSYTAVITSADDVPVGIADASLQATPLPSTWLTLLSGFAGLGFFAYRGKRNRSAAIAAT